MILEGDVWTVTLKQGEELELIQSHLSKYVWAGSGFVTLNLVMFQKPEDRIDMAAFENGLRLAKNLAGAL